MCGFIALAGGESSKAIVKDFSLGLPRLQHRGQESAGASWSNGKNVDGYKGMGLVLAVFTPQRLQAMDEYNIRMIIAHTRYSTSGSSSSRNAQPHWLHDRRGRFAYCANGDVPDLEQKKKEWEKKGLVFETTNDSEFILKQIDYFIDVENPDWHEDFIHGIRRMMQTTRATYSGGLITGTRLYVFRDPYENRPLYIGRRGSLFVAASETTVFDLIHAEVEREVCGGEILVVQPNGEYQSVEGVKPKKRQRCIFEHIYFSRPDSRTPAGERCGTFRRRLGVKMAEYEKSLARNYKIDCALGVPESGNYFTDGYAAAMGIPFRVGIVRDGYTGRIFIGPEQEQDSRRDKADRKYTVLPDIAVGVYTADGVELISPMEDAMFGEDSIVRLTTLLVLGGKIDKAGYKNVHLRISAPRIVSPCFFGIDMKTEAQLIAANNSEEEIRQILGVASLLYLPIEKLDEVIREGGEDPDDYCRKCFGVPCAI